MALKAGQSAPFSCSPWSPFAKRNQIRTLRKAARDANDAPRDQLAAAQAETVELKGKSAAIEAALEREVSDLMACSSREIMFAESARRRRSELSKPKPRSSMNDADCRLPEIW
jgi:hypothetical protein